MENPLYMYRENSRDDDDDESIDSNDENHYRNDYPDEDEFGNGSGYSEDEEDIRRAVEDLDIGDNHLMFFQMRDVQVWS